MLQTKNDTNSTEVVIYFKSGDNQTNKINFMISEKVHILT